jgi:hypothetical protein
MRSTEVEGTFFAAADAGRDGLDCHVQGGDVFSQAGKGVRAGGVAAVVAAWTA